MGVLYGGIEAGGTKLVCAVGTGPDDLRTETGFPTTTPAETMGRVVRFFQEQQRQTPVAAIGIGSFGPLDMDPASPRFGHITNTPKAGWADTDFIGTIQRELRLPVSFDTDVNAAAWGEHRWGAAQGLDSFLYLTVGTGIGGGGMVNGKLMHGLLHPEMGHIRVPHDWRVDGFKGLCPYHGDCLEGLASGAALAERLGRPTETLPPGHAAWDLEAHYLALALANFICTLSPQRIIMGGGVMQQTQLFPLVRHKVQQLLNGYLPAPEILAEINSYIVPPRLGRRAGVLGAIALAQQAGKQSFNIS